MKYLQVKEYIHRGVERCTEGKFRIYYDDVAQTEKTPDTFIVINFVDVAGFQSALNFHSDTNKRIFDRDATCTVVVQSRFSSGVNAPGTIAQVVQDTLCNHRHDDIWFRNVRLSQVGKLGFYYCVAVIFDVKYFDLV